MGVWTPQAPGLYRYLRCALSREQAFSSPGTPILRRVPHPPEGHPHLEGALLELWMARLKEQGREHSGVRALELPRPPGVPQFSHGETPASNSFSAPEPGDRVQMTVGRHLDVQASKGGPTWPPQPDVGPVGRERGLATPACGPASGDREADAHSSATASVIPSISLTANVTTTARPRGPRAVVWGAEELGGRDGTRRGGRSWPPCHGQLPH